MIFDGASSFEVPSTFSVFWHTGSQPNLHLNTNHMTRSSARPSMPVRNNLRKALEQHDRIFSQNSSDWQPHSQNIRGVPNDFRYRNRWSGIPSKPKAVSRLYTPLNNLLNNILQFLDCTRMSAFRDHCPETRTPIWNSDLAPLLLVGTGRHFLCRPAERPLPITAWNICARDSARKWRRVTRAWSFGYRHATDDPLSVNRDMHSPRHSQQTLKYTCSSVQGLSSSPSLDYHAHPQQFCANHRWACFHGWKRRLGLDASFFQMVPEVSCCKGKSGKTGKIRARVHSRHHSLLCLRSRRSGTICFTAYEEAAPMTLFCH